ncbi:MAG: oligosaccharide flippase family protein [Longimicrobiales bacterium]|nr:oligosaccharide flippase family protein [Longimicrobiales bacterium]
MSPAAPDRGSTLRDRADTGVAWSAFHIWGTKGLQLGLILVLARLLTPRDFGLFAMAQVVLSLLHPVAVQGIPEALVQSDRDDDRTWATGFRVVMVGSVAAAAALVLAAPALAGLFSASDLTGILRWLAPGALLYGLHAMAFARIRSELAFSAHARAGLAGGAAELVVGVAVAAAGFGVWALVAGFYTTLVVETALLLRATGGLPWRGYDAAEYRRLLRFGRYIVAGSFTTFLNRRSDDFFVGLLLGAEVLGFYNVAYRLLELMTTVFLRAVDRVAFPVFSKLQSAPRLVADGIRTSFRFTSLVAFPAFAGLIMVAPDAVVVALGGQWTPAVAPLRILALGGVALCATNVLPGAIRAAGYPQWNVTIAAVKGVLLAAAFYAAAGLGLEAVAWVFAVGITLEFPVYFAAARRLFPLSWRGYLAEAAAPLAGTAVMVAALWLLSPALEGLNPTLRLTGMVVAGVAVYVGAALLLARGRVKAVYARARRVTSGR